MKWTALTLMALPFLAACSNSEKEARAMLNQAIQQWESGELVQALDTFDRIESRYLDTATATEAIKEQAALLETYQTRASSEYNRRINQGVVGRDVYQKVEAFHDQAGHYPERLNGEGGVYEGRFADHVDKCTYQSPLSEYGYELDCTKADAAFLADRQQRFRQSAEKIRARQAAASKDSGQSRTVLTKADLSPAQGTWEGHLNPSGDIPGTGFKALYINTGEPRKVIASETVDNVAISYPWDDFHGINSRDFGGYWVGNLAIQTSEVKRITVGQSRSKTRVLINGRVLYEGGSDQSILYRFEPGVHKVEVEFVNNWHTTELSVGIHPVLDYLRPDEIKARLKGKLPADYQVYYAGVYESSATNLMTVLNLEGANDGSDRPALLILSSYSPVKWYLSNPQGVDVRAIVYGSYKPGSTLAGDLPDSVARFPVSSRIGSYDLSPRCKCTAGRFRCEGTAMDATLAAVKSFTDQPLAGFAGHYSADSLRLPAIKIDDDYLADLKIKMSKIEAERAECKSKNDQDFETMFEG